MEEEVEIVLEEEQELDVELDNDVIEVEKSVKDYEKLDNQPQINGITLIKNKNSKDLKLQDEMETISNLDIDKIFNN